MICWKGKSHFVFIVLYKFGIRSDLTSGFFFGGGGGEIRESNCSRLWLELQFASNSFWGLFRMSSWMWLVFQLKTICKCLPTQMCVACESFVLHGDGLRIEPRSPGVGTETSPRWSRLMMMMIMKSNCVTFSCPLKEFHRRVSFDNSWRALLLFLCEKGR